MAHHSSAGRKTITREGRAAAGPPVHVAGTRRGGDASMERPGGAEALQRVIDESPRQERQGDRIRALASPPAQRKPAGGGAGLPGPLRTGLETLSGQDLSDVRVHRGSSAPARVGAHAFAQGRDIHLAPGQERHLPHEGWHVVQQAQGRVRPTLQAYGMAVNDDPALEREADAMGDRALRPETPIVGASSLEAAQAGPGGGEVVQRRVGFELEDSSWHPWGLVPAPAAAPGAVPDHVQAVPRQAVIHVGTNWTLQADDTPGGGVSNIEAVTDPFSENAAGQNALVATMAEIIGVFGALAPRQGRPGPAAPAAGPQPLVAANYVGAAEHALSGSPAVPRLGLLLSGGSTDGRIKLQATSGIPLAEVAQKLRMYGFDPTAPAPHQHDDFRRTFRGDDGSQNAHLKLVGGAPRIGEQALALIHADPVVAAGPHAADFLPGSAEGNRMVGFLTILGYIIKTMNLALGEEGKYRGSMFFRNLVSATFGLLTAGQRAVLAAHPALLTNHLLAACNAVLLYPAARAGMEPRAPGNALVRPTQAGGVPNPAQARLGGYTVGHFLNDAAQGTDRLTPGDMQAWLTGGGMGAADAAESADFFESFGAFPVDADRVLFENRGMAPTGDWNAANLTVGRAAQAAFDYFSYIRAHP